MANDKTATFSIRIESNAKDVAPEASRNIQKLKDSIEKSQSSIKRMSASLKLLRGDSDRVRAAKAQLKNLIDVERNSVSRVNLRLLELGQTYEKVAGQTKKGAKETGLFGAILDKIPGSLKAMIAGLSALELTKLAFEANDTNREMGLMREAALGSAEGAAALGSQVDALARKIPTPKKELNSLSVELYRALSTTQVTGQGIVDTFNAVAEASAAAGPEAGNAIKGMIDASKRAGRLQIGSPLDFFQRTGVDYSALVESVKTQFKLTTQAAREALFSGRVDVNAGAKAIRDAVEKTFGGINARKLLSFNVQIEKLKEKFLGLAESLLPIFEPLLVKMGQFLEMFDKSTITGKALSSILGDLGNAVKSGFELAGPFLKGFFKGTIIAALELEIVFYKVRNAIYKAFGLKTKEQIDLVAVGVETAKIAAGILVGYLASLAISAAAVAAPFVAAAGAVTLLLDQVIKLRNEMKGVTLKELARPIENLGFDTAGFSGQDVTLGGNARGGLVKPAAGEMLASVKSGEHIVPPGHDLSTGRSPNRKIELHLTINHEGSGSLAEAKEQLSSPSFIGQITNALEDALSAAGIPAQAPNPGVT